MHTVTLPCPWQLFLSPLALHLQICPLGRGYCSYRSTSSVTSLLVCRSKAEPALGVARLHRAGYGVDRLAISVRGLAFYRDLHGGGDLSCNHEFGSEEPMRRTVLD